MSRGENAREGGEEEAEGLRGWATRREKRELGQEKEKGRRSDGKAFPGRVG